MGDQIRVDRWEAGLLKQPPVLPERELDICLMKQTRRIIYRGGYLQFENLTYQSDELAAFAGETVVLRYDPRDITRILVYRREAEHDTQGALISAKETFLAPAIAEDLETEKLSLEEAQANSRRIREQGKTVDNQSMLDEIHDREAFVGQRKKSRRERQKEEQARIQPKSKSKQTDTPQLAEPESKLELQEVVEIELPQVTVWDFDDED
ncbi:MAG TPA: Mu transposase C-terminal domain-containing protein [Coleofasciculaceae cyanobacterium]|jgi:putative transposase